MNGVFIGLNYICVNWVFMRVKCIWDKYECFCLL